MVAAECRSCGLPSVSTTVAPASRAMRTPARVSQGVFAEGDAGVQAAVGDPGQVQGGGAEHADAVDAGGELDGGG